MVPTAIQFLTGCQNATRAYGENIDGRMTHHSIFQFLGVSNCQSANRLYCHLVWLRRLPETKPRVLQRWKFHILRWMSSFEKQTPSCSKQCVNLGLLIAMIKKTLTTKPHRLKRPQWSFQIQNLQRTSYGEYMAGHTCHSFLYYLWINPMTKWILISVLPHKANP